MQPMLVADIAASGGRRIGGIVAFEPLGDIEAVDLFAPEEACEGLSLDKALVRRGLWRVDRIVKFVGLGAA